MAKNTFVNYKYIFEKFVGEHMFVYSQGLSVFILLLIFMIRKLYTALSLAEDVKER